VELVSASLILLHVKIIFVVDKHLIMNWFRFLNNLPLLHFLSDREAFVAPTPLLLASVLYISALHHRSSELASFDSGYFAATCSAINELLTPNLRPGLSIRRDSQTTDDSDSLPPKRKAFNDILGLIMASLSSEAYIDATGSWIAMAYRLWLDHCPAQIDSTTPDWQGLFSGLQVRSPSLSLSIFAHHLGHRHRTRIYAHVLPDVTSPTSNTRHPAC